MTYKKNFNDTAVFRTKNVRLVINSSAHLFEESNKLSKSFIFVSENIHDLHLGSIIVVVNSCSAMKVETKIQPDSEADIRGKY